MIKAALKYLITLLSIILFQVTVNSQDKSDSLFVRTKLNFYILESEISEGKYVESEILDNGFAKYDNKEIPNSRLADDRMITLRSDIYIDSIYADQKLYMVVMPVNSPCNIYLNGELLFIQGDYKEGYTSRLHYSENVFLLPNMIRFNKKNQIAFQLYPREGETNPLNQPFIAGAREAKKYVFYRNLFGPKLIMASLFCGLILFFYFLFIYISRKEYGKQQYFYFALMNLFLIFSLINNILTYDFTNTFLVELTSRIGFQLAMIAGLLFLIEYTTVFKRKLYFKIGVLVLYIPAIILLLFQPNLASLIQVNNSFPMYILMFGNLSFVIIVLLYYLKEKDSKSFMILFIYTLNLLAGFYDGYYFVVLKVKPFLLLTPNSIVLVNLTIFFILLIDQSKIYHVAIKSSKELRELNENLELIVDERTAKTVEYSKKLEEANQTKDKFFSIIAHDLKNPFNTLIGYADVLKSDFREYSQDEIYQHLNTIYNTSVNGYNLLENLLKWSQSQTNKIRFEPKKVNLCDVVNSCIQDSENQSNFKDIELINEVSKNYHIIADKNLLKTVIRNLINNAIKFTERNGMIVIKSTKKDNIIEFSIKDTGIGMKEEEIENLFKIDKINSKPGTDRERGSGLGLILCKEFVEIHGGKIWAESTLGSGSEFKFTIPKMISIN
jgi:signal transduction histidine kinase